MMTEKKFTDIVTSLVESKLPMQIDEFTTAQYMGEKDPEKVFRVIDKEEGEVFFSKKEFVAFLLTGE